MKLNKMKNFLVPTKTKAVALGSAFSLFAMNAFAVLSTEATALVASADAATKEVKDVTWAVAPGVLAIVGAVAVVVLVIMLVKKGK